MAKVVAIVLNSVSRDARVLKEANSLQAAGHEVTVIGVADRDFPAPRTLLDSRVTILRVASGSLSQPTSGEAAVPVARRQGPRHLIGAARRRVRALLETRAGREAKQRALKLLERYAPAVLEGETGRRARQRTEDIVRLARSLQPDIVHCHDVRSLPAGTMLKQATGCLLVYDAHEIYEELAQASPAAVDEFRRIHVEHLPLADGFVTINESIAGWYAEHYPALPPATTVMNATVRAAPFAYDGRLHTAAGLPAGAKILLYQGGYAEKRGLEALVASAGHIPGDWTLVMMGFGGLESRLRQLAADVNAATAGVRPAPVRFVPPVAQAELAQASAGATVGIIPYENTGLNHWFCTPNKLWEYPNAGVPVLVSPFPELRRFVEQFGYGWLLPEGADETALGRQLASLTEAQLAAARAACAVFSDAESWAKYETRLVALYEKLTALTPPGLR